MRILKIASLILVVLVVGLLIFTWPTFRVATAFAAKHACSCMYIQDRSLEEIKAHDLNFSILPQIDITPTKNKTGVEASFFGLVSSRAYFQEKHGCTLHYEDLKATALPQIRTSNLKDTFYNQANWIETDAMQKALDNAFEPVPGGGTRGFVVLHQGKLVAERYAPPFTAETPLLGWSMTKSVTNAITALVIKEGKISLDQQNLLPEWEDERSQITLQHLLHMNTGLDWNESYGTISDVTQMLYLEPDMTAFAAAKELAAPIGTKWAYSSGTTNLIHGVLARTFPDPASYQEFIQDSLFNAIGMQSALIEADASGIPVGSSYGWATARDWARLGQLYLQDGMWMGKRILPEGWITQSREEVVAADGIYGAQIWLKGPDMPNAPDDIFMFRGFQDQRVFIVPSRECVIVRLGHNDDKVVDFDTILQLILVALPTD